MSDNKREAAWKLYEKVKAEFEKYEAQAGSKPKAVLLLQSHVDLLNEYIVDGKILGVEIQVGEEKEGAKHE